MYNIRIIYTTNNLKLYELSVKNVKMKQVSVIPIIVISLLT